MNDKVEYAGVLLRFLAKSLDWVVLYFLRHILDIIIGATSTAEYFFQGEPIVLFCIICFCYYWLLEGLLGGTVGKMLMGIKVCSPEGVVCGLKASFLRNILRLIDVLPFFYLLGAVLVLDSTQQQRLGDKIAHTLVVRKNCFSQSEAAPKGEVQA